MHFSLILPPEGWVAEGRVAEGRVAEGRAPVWPRIGGNGRVIWPEGAEALHRAAYTFVWLDEAAGRFAFDVFVHEGGRTTVWATRVAAGATVAVMGPGGGDFPLGDRLLIAGDETALPAIRRILERSAPGRRGLALIEAAAPGDRLDLARPAGMALRWIDRGGLLDAVRRAALPAAGESRFVWVAAEQEVVRAAKAHFRETAGLGRQEGYFSAYWSR